MFTTVIVILVIFFLLFTIVKMLSSLQKETKGITLIFSLMLFIVAYNLFVVNGHQSAYSFIADRLTYTDALIFYMLIPLFYIALLKMTHTRDISSFKNAVHLWPILPGLLFTVNFNSLSVDQQNEVVMGRNCGQLPDWILYTTGAVSVMFYLVLAITFLHRYNRNNEKHLNSLSRKQLSAYIWVLYLCFILCICFGVLTLCAENTEHIHNIIICLLLCLSIVVLYIAFYSKPSLIIDFKIADETNEIDVAKNAQFILSQINQTMESQKLFLDQNLCVAKIAQSVNISETEITNAIRAEYQMSIQEFVNMHRVVYAKKLLDESDFVKVDFLAFDSGFSARSTFYSSFKKHTGMTPMQYKKTSTA